MSVRRIEWPADLVLLGIRALGLEYRVTPGGRWGWVASCPCCGQVGAVGLRELPNPEDRYDEGGPVRLRAQCGCPAGRVQESLLRAAAEGTAA